MNRRWRRPDLQVVTVHNAAVAVVEGRTVVLFRSHLRSGVSAGMQLPDAADPALDTIRVVSRH